MLSHFGEREKNSTSYIGSSIEIKKEHDMNHCGMRKFKH